MRAIKRYMSGSMFRKQVTAQEYTSPGTQYGQKDASAITEHALIDPDLCWDHKGMGRTEYCIKRQSRKAFSWTSRSGQEV